MNNLKKIVRTDAAFEILDNSNCAGSDWGSGGCAILAQALNKLEGYPIYVIYNTKFKGAEHFGVKTPSGRFLDHDGEHSSEEAWLDFFIENEMPREGDLVVIPFGQGVEMDGIKFDDNAADELAKLIKKHKMIREVVRSVLSENLIPEAYDSQYKSWKRKNVTIRGVKEVGEENNAGAMLGRGLYTAFLSNKSLAKQYGDVKFVIGAIPKNPKVFNTLNEWEIWFYNTLVYKYSKEKGNDFPDRRDFSESTTIEDEMQKLGYDGIVIKGREMVNFNPGDVMYFSNEKQLFNYYDGFIRDSINESVISEYITRDEIYLRDYLSMSEEQKKEYLPHEYHYFFEDFLVEDDIEFEMPKEKVPSDYQDEPDEEVDMFEDTIELMTWLENNNREVYDAFANYLYRKITNNELPIPESEYPAWSYFDDSPELVKNQWLIHFTGDADGIADSGFQYGVDDMSKLGLTTHLGDFDKKYGGYNFAYLLSDFVRYAKGDYSRGRRGYKYGDEAVIFRASGIKVWHHGDQEPQVIFYGNTATNIIPITSGDNSDWSAKDKNERVLFEDDELEKVVNWIVNNYQQYRKSLNESFFKEEVIQETQTGQKDLEKLTNDILKHLSREILKSKAYSGDEPITSFPIVNTIMYNGEGFEEIGDFVEETNIRIVPTRLIRGKKSIKGELEYGPGDSFGNEFYKIWLKYDSENLDGINELFKVKGGEITDTDIYFNIFYLWYSTLLHELQHAYDAWRSKGKAFGGQLTKTYTSIQDRANQVMKSKSKYDDLTPEEIDAINTSRKAYLNLVHEINARYAQAMHKTVMTGMDYDTFDDIKKEWNKVYSEFKLNFFGWRHLSDKMKRKLTRRLAKAYQEEIENLKTASEKYSKEDLELVSESGSVENVWYHGTPDVRDIEKEGGFTQRYINIDYVEDIDEWNRRQQAMSDARERGDEKEYFKIIDTVGELRKNEKIRKPIFLTNVYSVAKTYSDKPAFDYQNAEEKVLKVKVNSGKGVTINAPGQRFRFIDIEPVRRGFINAGVDPDSLDAIISQLNYATGTSKGIRTDDIAAIGDWLGFDYIDVVGVLDSYQGGSTKSTVRMVFDPSDITIIRDVK